MRLGILVLNQLKRIEDAKAIMNGDLVGVTKTFAIGDGMWSIEVYDDEGNFMTEFVGLNGTREGEVATDLWAEYAQWCQELHHWRGAVYRCPNGFTGTLGEICREFEAGRLHDCLFIV